MDLTIFQRVSKIPKPKLIIASGAGLCGVSGVGGGIYFLAKYLSGSDYITTLESTTKTVRTKLQDKKFEVLDLTSSSHWGTLTQEYNKVKTDSSKVFLTSSQDISETTLKDLCQKALEEDGEGSVYLKARRWCVVPVSVSKHWEIFGFKPLTEESLKTEGHKWRITTYDSSREKIKNLETLTTENKEKSLIESCKALGEKKNYEDDLDSNLTSFQTWCATQ